MLTNRRGLISAEIALGVIAAFTIVEYAAGDKVQQGTVAGVLYGVSTDAGATEGQVVDIVLSDITPVLYGAAVARGNRLKSDATGRAIPALATENAIGYAQVSGVVGDIGSILIDRTTAT
jgi:hypothetical protein